MTPRTALWAEIAEAVATDIATGAYRPGDKLPSEAALATRFGVNRHTVRRALAHLSAGNLVRTRQGAGAFVAHRPTEYPLGRRTRFSENLRAAGRLPGREILALETRAATGHEAAQLNLATGARVHMVLGLGRADGVPLSLNQSVFPAALLPNLPRDLSDTKSITAALRRGGILDYTRAHTRLSAEIATATQAGQLDLPLGAALLRTEGLNVDPTGRPVEFGTTWFVGDRVTLTVGGE